MTGQRVHLVEHWRALHTACGRWTRYERYNTANMWTTELDQVTCITCKGTHLYFELRKSEGTVKLRDGSHQRILADA